MPKKNAKRVPEVEACITCPPKKLYKKITKIKMIL